MAIERIRDKQKTEPQSPELSEKVYLAKLMDSVLARFPNQTITQETSSAWLKDWALLFHQAGKEPFEWALRQCCLSCRFFPSPADIQEMALTWKPQTKTVLLPDANCPKCRGTSWEPVGNAVKRCSCRIETVLSLREDGEYHPPSKPSSALATISQNQANQNLKKIEKMKHDLAVRKTMNAPAQRTEE